ncbi:uncharacterized protein [Procambarus clarkii]|uniref:uncharacterized protein n=1 Tax=Procambarus clarkii TaxID=6728 RepID=UPI003741EAC3
MSKDELDPSVHKLWDLATLSIVPEQPSPDDDWTYKQYQDSVVYRDNQYWVRLPWKLNHSQLLVNHFMAQNQLRSHVLRLQRHPENMKLYHEIIKKQLDDKFIKVVTNDNLKEGHYLPHHPVLKNSAMTPLRIVFHCSAKTKQSSVSLNDCLQTGPSLTQQLYDVLLKFRIGTYAYTADISKAFVRVGLQEEDCNYTKFLWIKDPNDPNTELITLRFASVLFGAMSSSFLLQATVDIHLKKSNSPNKTEISNNLYVDNFQGTASSESKLLNIYHEANLELMGANMPLQSSVSNNAKLNQLIRTEFPNYQVPKKTKVLGVK